MRPDPGRQRLGSAPTWPIVASTLTLMTFIAVESFAVTTVLPVVAGDLDGTRWYSFAYAATITMALVGMVVGGTWADRSGITVPLVCGGAFFLVGIALCVIAQDMSLFVVGRLLQGLGGGVDSVLVYVIIARHVPQQLQARMFGLLAAAWLVPSMVGPLAAGALAELLHWRVVFAAVLLGSAVALATLVATTRQPAPATRTGTVFGRRGWWALVAAGCLVSVHLGGQQPFPSNVFLLGVGVLGLVVAGSRLLPPGTLRARPGIPALIATRGLLGAAVAATDVYLPLYLQAERGYTPTSAGLVVAIGAIGWAAGAWIQGREASSGYREGPTILLATVLVFIGPLTVLALVAGVVPIAAVIAACILMGTGMGLAYPRISSGVLTRSSPEQHGQHSSALQASESMSISAFLAMTGAVLTISLGSAGYITVYGMAGAVVLLAGAVGRHQTIPAQTTATVRS